MSDNVAGNDPYLLVEEVAERLGLPLSVLLHRVEAGDIPARRIESADGVHYALRLGDLGIELDDEGLRSSAIQEDDESTLSASLQPPVPPTGPERHSRQEPLPPDSGIVFTPNDSSNVHSAIASAFNSGPALLPSRSSTDETDSAQRAREESPAWSLRRREPQEPPGPSGPGTGPTGASEEADAESYLPPSSTGARAADEDDGIPSLVHASDEAAMDDRDDETAVAELAVPPPSRRSLGILSPDGATPRGDLASMSLDARELVAGLLDRWERTLEQRIYTEQRQRFQAELVARQNMVKQLQMELHTARAEHAAAQAEKDRMLASKERELADRERDLANSRRGSDGQSQLIAPVGARRRRWFRSRDD